MINTEEEKFVWFRHPHYYHRHFIAELTTDCTGQQVLEDLKKGIDDNPFLDPKQLGVHYHLRLERTGTDIDLHQTLGEVGVQDGDVVQVLQRCYE